LHGGQKFLKKVHWPIAESVNFVFTSSCHHQDSAGAVLFYCQSETVTCPRCPRLYRRIYLVYPQLGTEIGTYLHNNSLGVLDASGNPIWQSATAKLQTTENQLNEIWQSAIAKLEEWSTPADWLFNKLNYTSLAYLTSIEEPLKRAFYEQETSLILNSRRYASSSSDCDGLDGLRPPVFLGDNVRSRTDS